MYPGGGPNFAGLGLETMHDDEDEKNVEGRDGDGDDKDVEEDQDDGYEEGEEGGEYEYEDGKYVE
jgi:hypothetical protein